MQEPWQWTDEQCWAFSLGNFAKELSEFLAFQLIADVVLVNMIDFVCPAWWMNVVLASKKTAYQKHLNKLYDGVDFKPYLRVQVLLKFLFTAMCINQISGFWLNANFWVAICFWQCYEIERYLFVTRYKQPTNYSHDLVHFVIEWCLPFALLVHSAFSFFVFGWTWEIPMELHLPNGTFTVHTPRECVQIAEAN